MRKAVKLQPNEGAYVNTLSLAEYRCGHWTESLAASRRSMELGGFVLDNFLQAKLWRWGGKATKARPFLGLEKAVAETKKSYPGDGMVCQLLAEAADVLGQPGPDAAGAGGPRRRKPPIRRTT